MKSYGITIQMKPLVLQKRFLVVLGICVDLLLSGVNGFKALSVGEGGLGEGVDISGLIGFCKGLLSTLQHSSFSERYRSFYCGVVYLRPQGRATFTLGVELRSFLNLWSVLSLLAGSWALTGSDI